MKNEVNSNLNVQQVKVNYKNSGVKTLSGFAIFFSVIGGIALLSGLIICLVCLWNDDEINTALVSALISAGIVLLFFATMCVGLSGIAKTALYKRTLLEQEHDFKDVTPDTWN
jgi:hypothetical protein